VAIVVGVIVGLVVLGVGSMVIMGLVLASKVNVHTERDAEGREKMVRVETPFGRFRVDRHQRIDPKQLGLPIYPGAVVLRDTGTARVEIDLDFADTSLRVVAAEMETTDAFDKVVDFYRDQAADFVFTKESGRKVKFIWHQERLKKVIGIIEKGGKTRIALASVGEPEAN
jgi:hypothetical protein